MSNVYIVTSGEYSGYHIEAVFTDPVRANAFAAERRDPDCRVEVYALDEAADPTAHGLSLFEVIMDRDGDGEVQAVAYAEGVRFPQASVVERQGAKRLYLLGLARDEQHAVKIANEARARLLAEQHWIWE